MDQDHGQECPICGSVQATLETTDPTTLDLISWSLRLPLLREAWGEGPTDLAESERLYALITEGERALGILPPEGE